MPQSKPSLAKQPRSTTKQTSEQRGHGPCLTQIYVEILTKGIRRQINDIAGALRTLGGRLANMGLTRKQRVVGTVVLGVQFEKRSFVLCAQHQAGKNVRPPNVRAIGARLPTGSPDVQ